MVCKMALVSFLACLACIASMAYATDTKASTENLPTGHGHHHHHAPSPAPVKPPTYAPHKPPTHPPIKPPAHPPVKPPSHPPVKPPAHPPVKPPSHPPVKPPAHPPVKPPSHPPVKPPAHPPVKPPSHPPVKPPAHPPVKPPTHPPTKPPTYPPVQAPIKPPTRKYVAVQGVVYCKSCKYFGIPTLIGATPLAGAKVMLKCKNTKNTQATATTDKKGYYFLQAPKTVSSFASHKCKVYLLSSPSKQCSKPTNLNWGVAGSSLLSPTPLLINKLPYLLYSVAPLAFEPAKKCY